MSIAHPPRPSPPLISVVLPVYNCQDYLRPAIDSILAQSFTDFELICVDDGSKDGSLGILREYEKRDPRLIVISRPNTGFVGALNDALKIALGEYIARMDGDDISRIDRFARQVAYLREHPDCVLVGGAIELIDPGGRPICLMDSIQQTHDQINVALLAGDWPICHPSIMIRRRALEQAGGYIAEHFPLDDHHLFLRLGEVGQLANPPGVVLQYRKHPKSVVMTMGAVLAEKMNHVVTEAQTRRGLPVQPPLKSNSGRVSSARTLHRIWGWWALKAGNIGTARHHAWKYLTKSPFSPDGWRLMLCAMRGR